MKLLDIAKSWYLFIKADAEDLQKAETKINICDGCPDKVQMSEFGQYIINAVNSESSTYKCGLCKCPLASKVFSAGTCPAGNW